MKQFRVLIVLLLLPAAGAETTFFDQDDGIILGNSPTTTEGTGRTIAGTSGGGCRYDWNCTNWSGCPLSGKQTRNCLNVGTCSDQYNTPPVEQKCTYTAGQNKVNEWLEQENALPDELELPILERQGIRNTKIKNNYLVKKEVINWNKIGANFIISWIIASLIIMAVIILLKRKPMRIK